MERETGAAGGGNGTAMKNNALLLAAYFLLGLVLLGLFAYMYDQVNRGKSEPPPKSHLWGTYKFLWFWWMAPFVYLAQGLEAKDRKAIVVFAVFAVLLAAAICAGNAA